MTNTQILEIARSMKAGNATAQMFSELAAIHGLDTVGLAWVQACLAVDQGAV